MLGTLIDTNVFMRLRIESMYQLRKNENIHEHISRLQFYHSATEMISHIAAFLILQQQFANQEPKDNNASTISIIYTQKFICQSKCCFCTSCNQNLNYLILTIASIARDGQTREIIQSTYTRLH